MTQLTDEQLRAVQSPHPFNLICAAPGSGKTAVLVNRIVHMIKNGVPPITIVAITYTNAAAREIQKRVAEAVLFDTPPRSKFAEKVHREYSSVAKEPFALGYIGTIHGLFLRLLRSHKSPTRLPKISVIDEEQAGELLERCALDLHYKGTAVALKTAVAARMLDLDEGAERMNDAGLVAFEYSRRMWVSGCLSYDAILAFGAKVLHEHWPSIKAPGVILVDEFQDCSALVAEALRALPIEVPRFYVGDPNQSIFGFTGGDPSHMLALYGEGKLFQPFQLETNFRSTPAICEAANRLIGHNKIRIPITIKANAAADDDAYKVESWGCQNAVAERSRIAQAIIAIMGAPLISNAVLCRTNAMVAEFTHFLTAMGVPVRVTRKRAWPLDWGIARRFVALASNPNNDVLAYSFLVKTRDKKFADKIRLQASEKLASINKSYLHLPDEMGLAELPEALRQIGIGDESRTLIAEAAAGMMGGGLPELCLALGSFDFGEEIKGDENAVEVCTIHSAKGREWDWVFVAGCEDEFWPGKSSGSDLEEERRLMYVAITRARERVILTWAKERANPWDLKLVKLSPSRFLEEMGARGV